MSTDVRPARRTAITAVFDERVTVLPQRPVTVQEISRITMAVPQTAYVPATAEVDLMGHRAVCLGATGAHYADPLMHCDVAGITTGAALQGTQAIVQVGDALFEPSWNWSLGPVYLGANGTLTQSPPTSGSQVQIGLAITPKTLLIRVQPPIQLT